MNFEVPPPPDTTLRELPALEKVKPVHGIYIGVLKTSCIDKVDNYFEGIATPRGIIYFKIFGVLLIFIKILGFNSIPTVAKFCEYLNDDKYNKGAITLTKEDRLILRIYSNKATLREKNKYYSLNGRHVYFEKPGKLLTCDDDEIHEKSEYCRFVDFITALQGINELTETEKTHYWKHFIEYGDIYMMSKSNTKDTD